MGNVLSYFSSIVGSKSRAEHPDPNLRGEKQAEAPQPAPQQPVDVDEIAIGLKSTLISSRDQWDKVIDSATEEPAEIPVISMYLQLRAYTASSGTVTSSEASNEFLCVREKGRVCFDGKENALNTIFKVSRVYPPPIDKYQFVCTGRPSKSFVLYPEESGLKSKRFDADKDYACKDTAEPTLMSVEINDEDQFLVTLESRHGVVSGTDSEPIKFIPYLADGFQES